MVVVFVDITKQVRSEHDLNVARDRTHALLDNSGQGFLSFGADLVVHNECSRACEAMLGLAPAGATRGPCAQGRIQACGE
ncbi:MAG: hypothetical protein WCK65_13805 [Rhodospirillaceae bacterium]